MTANDKTYDATANATVSGGSLSGLIGTETLTFSGQTASFADRNAGNNKAVSVAGIALGDGTGLASNYELVMPSGLNASILPKALTISGVAAASKFEDGNTIASLTAHGTLSGVEPGDAVHIDAGAAAAQFAQSTPGTGIAVNVSGLVLAGADAHNYSLSGDARTTANITAVPAPAPTPAPAPVPQVVSSPAPTPQPVAVPAPEVVATPTPTPVPTPEVIPVPAPAPVPVVVQVPLPAPAPVALPTPAPVPVPSPAPVASPAPTPAPVVVQVPVDPPAPVLPVAPAVPPLETQAVIPTPVPVAVPAPAPVAAATPAPASTPAPVAAPTPAPVAQPSPAADLKAAISTQAASPALQGGVTPAMPSLSVGGLNYTDVSESSGASATSNSRETMPVTQSLTAGRDVKFLSVFVVSGGIQMPAAVTSNDNASTSDKK